MNTVLSEVADKDRAIDSHHVQRRVDDWVHRVQDIYRQIRSWLPAGWDAKDGQIITMNEPMMQKHGVESHNFHMLDLYCNGQLKGWIEPRYLWIIGANGRIDLHFGEKHYIITDQSNNFEKSHWRVCPIDNRREVKDFNQNTFKELI